MLCYFFRVSRSRALGSQTSPTQGSYDSKKTQITMTETGVFCSLGIAYRWDEAFDFHCFGECLDEKSLFGAHNRARGHENRAPAHVDIFA